MTTTALSSSAWSKPGKWALESEGEEHEKTELVEQPQENGQFDFPPLTTAAATTKSKKKKGQAISLAEFSTGKPVGPGTGKAAQTATHLNRLTIDEVLSLPTGPRERSAEELERSRHGFRSYALNESSGRSRYSNGDESSNSKWGSSRVSDEPRRNGGFNRDSGPSRADENDDWSGTKKSAPAPAPASERRERSGFSDSHTKADESASWVSNKSHTPPEGRRFGDGFENHRDRRGGFGTVVKETSNEGRSDSDTWGKKREEGTGGESGRRRLVLQPRTLPVNSEDQQLQQQAGTGSMSTRSKGSNPFGEARPREEVLAEKGQDWKKIDEQLESMKLKEKDAGARDAKSLQKKSFGSDNGSDTETSWRKTGGDDIFSAQSAGKTDEEGRVAQE